MVQAPDSTDSLLPEQEDKLRELTAQSWNLELVVSGVIMFSVLQVPDLLDSAFDYIHYNLMGQTTGVAGLLPILAVSMMNTSCYVLFGAFLTNFVMRAFWVALVGLLAVYPTGIHYDRIPFSTPYAQQRMRDELGPLDRYIFRLDQRCNVVFAVAFIFVFFLIAIALAYVIGLVIYAGLRPLIPSQYWQWIKTAFFVVFALYMLCSLVLSLPKVRAQPGMTSVHYRFTTLSRLALLGMHVPFSFISNTFYSHIPRQKLLKRLGLLFGVLYTLMALGLFFDISRQGGRASLFGRRHLYSSRLDSLIISPGTYNDQLADDHYVEGASIQADVIREPFIRLYIAYPKALDTLLTRVAPEPAWDAKLSVSDRRDRFAHWSNEQINRLVQIQVNDSLYQKPALLFTERGGLHQRGWQTILIPTNMKPGRNNIRVSILAGPSEKPEKLALIPFWYVPEQ